MLPGGVKDSPSQFTPTTFTDVFKITGSEDFGLQKRHLAILAKLYRKALLGVSRAAFKPFEDSNVGEAIKQVNLLLVPGLGALAGNPSDGDTEVLEGVREEWCQSIWHIRNSQRVSF
jgi:hypothetical protein